MNYVVETYENYKEENRLTTNNARKIEFITTVKALDALFPPKVKLLDCAAGTGVYAFYYAEKGYDVTALDITPRHIDIINNDLKTKPYSMKTGVNDATDLSKFPDETFDIVLCMGPIYHLTEKSMRDKCLLECLRVLKKGGLLVTAYINKFYVLPYLATIDSNYINSDLAKNLIETGIIKHDDPNCFWTDSYYSTPEELEITMLSYNLEIVDHLSTDGLSPFLKDEIDNLNDNQFKVWCDYQYSVCREKSILGSSNHGLIIARK